ncbi:CPBP family intramembrane glutamic endopeptidase [Apilactobacillus xinyiensis]|uniref:CPBP family intramembrane glutamic endopeptidase n=2 Tax=Apilactobacillus xinyiensis TaxID=2841032 RepID=UPI001C7CE355|nr:CPBP family intramembrane glutamic endopeptidase [Apilactobacillus xinyiensis]
MTNLKNFKSILWFSIIVFATSILINIASSYLVILTKIPLSLLAYIQFILLMLAYVFLNKKIAMKRIHIKSYLPFKYQIIPYLTAMLMIVYLLRPNSHNAEITFNQFFIVNIANCVGAAICEEYFVRGILLKSLLQLYKKRGRMGILYAIFAASVIFALFHTFEAVMTKSWIEILVPFCLGIILCAIYIACESIIPCIIFHFAYDFMVYFLNNNVAGITIPEYIIITLIITSIILLPVMWRGSISEKFYK